MLIRKSVDRVFGSVVMLAAVAYGLAFPLAAEAYTAASRSDFIRKHIPASVIEAYGR